MEKIGLNQEEFFKKIRQSIPSYENLAQSIASVLGISTNEAYNKIKGSSQLTIAQIVKMCDFYDVTFNYSPAKRRSVNFEYQVSSNKSDMEDHLKQILSKLQMVTKAKTKGLTIVSDDIPFFYLFKYRELGLFKVAYWQSSLDENMNSYDPEYLPESYATIITEIHDTFLTLPTVEIWSKNAILSTIEQIRYAFDAGKIQNKETALLIVYQLKETLNNIQGYAVSKKKTTDDQHHFEWFYADVIGSVVFLLDYDNGSICFNRFNTFHFIETNDEGYCARTREWINRLIKKSTCFSGQGEKHRSQFINFNLKLCDELIKYIKHA